MQQAAATAQQVKSSQQQVRDRPQQQFANFLNSNALGGAPHSQAGSQPSLQSQSTAAPTAPQS